MRPATPTTVGMAALAIAAMLTPGAGQAGPSPSPRATYILRCAGCHGMEGLGTEAGGIPGFPGSIATLAGDDTGRTYMVHVPGVVGSSLDDAEIGAVLNYVLERWGAPGAPPFSAEEVTRRRAEPVADVVALRSRLTARLAAEGKPLAPYPWP